LNTINTTLLTKRNFRRKRSYYRIDETLQY
jgi:hypothetical protein